MRDETPNIQHRTPNCGERGVGGNVGEPGRPHLSVERWACRVARVPKPGSGDLCRTNDPKPGATTRAAQSFFSA